MQPRFPHRRPQRWLQGWPTFAALLLVLACGQPRSAGACTRGPDPQPTPLPVAELVARADLLVLGTVSALADGAGGMPGATATVAVEAYLKGSGPASLTIGGFGPEGICLAPVSLGARYLFAAVPDGAGGYRGLYLGHFKPALTPQPELLAAVRAALGEQAPATTTPAIVPAPPRNSGGEPQITWLPSLVAAGLLAGLWFLGPRRKRRR